MGHGATPTPARATCATGSTTGSTGSSATPAFKGEVGGETHRVPPGPLSVPARRVEARVPPQHEQQLVGPRLQRGRARSSARRPTTARASSCRSPTATTSRCAAGRRGCWRTSPTPTASSRSPTRSARSTGTAGSPRRPAMRSTPPGRIRATTGTGPRSSASRPGTWSPRSRSTARGATSPRTTAGTCSPATTSGPRRSRRRSAPTATSGRSTGTTSSSSTTRRPKGFRDRQGERLRDPPARQDARPHLPDRPEGREADRDRPRSTRPTRRGLVAALKNDNLLLAAARPAPPGRAGQGATSCPT